MISHDTVGWSNDTENPALTSLEEIKNIFKKAFQIVMVFHNLTCCIFDQINAALVRIRDFKNF